jgi:hypothetical protein
VQREVDANAAMLVELSLGLGERGLGIFKFPLCCLSGSRGSETMKTGHVHLFSTSAG